MTCPHDILEMDKATNAGMCPLCMAARIERLKAERDEWKSSHQALEVYYVDGQARIERLVAAFDAFSKATSVSGGPSLTMQRHNQTWEAWKTLCNAVAALAGTEGAHEQRETNG